MSNLIDNSHGLPQSSLIESIDNRDQLSYHSFECVTDKGFKFRQSMLGFSRDHAYRRLRIQTDGSILIGM